MTFNMFWKHDLYRLHNGSLFPCLIAFSSWVLGCVKSSRVTYILDLAHSLVLGPTPHPLHLFPLPIRSTVLVLKLQKQVHTQEEPVKLYDSM